MSFKNINKKDVVSVNPGAFTYRPDIDGLRALAVVFVIIYHYFPNHLPGGFIGVDIFFVISGYLITSIIWGQMEYGQWTYRNFYTRRINRIFPALILVLVVNLMLGWYALVKDEFEILGKHVAASSVFMSNFALWSEAGYFDNAADSKPLLHLWSLAIEEQFYIVWPVLIAILIKKPERYIKVLAVILITSTFAYNIFAAFTDPTAAYYSPITRGWQLAAGGIVAYLALQPNKFNQIKSELQGVFGLFLLVIALALIDKKRDYPGWWALLPTLGTMFILMAGSKAFFNRTVFSAKPIIWIGLISYPLYLWHWPVLVWAKLVLLTNNLSFAIRIGLIAVTFLLAWATYKFIEKRIRLINQSKTAICLVAATIISGSVGVLAWSAAVDNRLANEDLAQIVASTKDWDYPPLNFKSFVKFSNYSFYVRHGKGPGGTLFVGDSNIEQYAPRIEAVLEREPESSTVYFATKGGCPFSVPLLAEQSYDCREKMAAIEQLIQSPQIDTIVFGQAWKNLLALQTDPEIAASFESHLASIPRDKRVFLILNMPTGLEFSPATLLTGSRLGKLEYKANANQTIKENVAREPFVELNRKLIEIAKKHNVIVIDPFNHFCSNDICPIVNSAGAPLYKDSAHITATYARKVASFLDVTVKPR